MADFQQSNNKTMNTTNSDLIVGIIYTALFLAAGPFAFWQQMRTYKGKKAIWPMSGGCLTQIIVSIIFFPYAIGAITAVILHDGITAVKNIFTRKTTTPRTTTTGGTPPRPPYETTIAGINFRGNLDEYLNEPITCTIEEDPTNTHDKNALKVLAYDGRHLGFIPAAETSKVRTHVDGIFPAIATAYIQKSNDETDHHPFYFADLTIR